MKAHVASLHGENNNPPFLPSSSDEITKKHIFFHLFLHFDACLRHKLDYDNFVTSTEQSMKLE
jgi:hypothetical protein